MNLDNAMPNMELSGKGADHRKTNSRGKTSRAATAVTRPLTCAVLAAMGLGLTGCWTAKPPPFDPKRIQQIQQQGVGTTEPRPLPPLPRSLEPSMRLDADGRPTSDPAPRPHILSTTQPYGTEVRLSLQEIIHRTAAGNLEARVAGYQSSIDEARILEAEARFDPTIFAEGQAQKTFPQFTGSANTDPNRIYTQNLEFGLRQLMTTGGQAELAYRITRNEQGSTASTDILGNPTSNPFPSLYINELTFQITQPILRDFGAETNLARITIARNDQKISHLDFREEVENALVRVEEAYWRLVQARRNVVILQGLLGDTERTLDVLIRRGQHDVARLQISQVRASLEGRNREIVNARNQVRDLSEQIKALMNDPELPEAGPHVIIPADEPLEQPITFALSDQIETALQNRLELAQQNLRVNSADTVVKAAIDNLKPRLDLTAQVGVQGLGRDFDDAVNSQVDFDFITYAFGFQFEVPIGNRQAQAIYQRTLLQRQQAIEQYYSLVKAISADVKRRQIEVESQWETLVAARRARFASEDALDAIEQRERRDEPLTFNFVQLKLDRQLQLAVDRQNELQAMVEYNIALANLERAKGTLLRYNNVAIREEKGPMFAKVAAIRETRKEARRR